MPGANSSADAESPTIESRFGMLLCAGVLLSIASFVFDLNAQLGVAAGIPYVGLVCLFLFGPGRAWIWGAAIVGIALTLLGLVLSEPGGEPWKIYLNRFLSILAIIVVAGLADLAKRQQLVLMAKGLDLQDTVNSQSLRLESSEQQFRRAFDSSPNGLALVDGNGVVEMANSRLAELFDYQVDELVHEHIGKLVPARYVFDPGTSAFSLRNGTGDSNAVFEAQIYGSKRGGEEFPIDFQMTPIDDAGAKSIVTVGDLSERVNYERKIERQSSRLRRLNTELLEFAYSASHDLKAPLASISGLLAFCKSDLVDGDTAEVLENLDKANELAERLASRVEAILFLARSDKDAGDTIDLAVPQRIQDAWDALPHEGVTIETSYEHRGTVRCVGSRFDVVVENLLSNAIKYRDTDAKNPWVRIKTWDGAGQFCLSVEDNGIGIAEEHFSNVFRLYHRLAGKEVSGTGLGLALVKRNVIMLGGSVELEKGERGARFVVKLPHVPLDEPIGGHGNVGSHRGR